MVDLSEVRRRAWKTRRQKYGPHGHNGTYTRGPSRCARCRQMEAFIGRLYAEGVLSEGQAAKATGLCRVAVRKLADDWRDKELGREQAAGRTALERR